MTAEACDLLAAGIRIGIARERLRTGYDERGPVDPAMLQRLARLGEGGSLNYVVEAWGATQELAVAELERQHSP